MLTKSIARTVAVIATNMYRFSPDKIRIEIATLAIGVASRMRSPISMMA